jgi:large repetitive protein
VQIGAYIIDGGSSAKYVTLSVTGPPIPLVAVGLNPASVPGGNSSTAWVTIGAPAPAEGMTMILSSSNTAVATVPTTGTVPAGITSTGITVLTNSVTSSTDVTISASSGGVTRSAVLTVNPAADIAAPDTSITSVVGGDGTPIGNGGATLSTIATIGFTGTDNVAVAGFECRLDGASFTSCSSPSKRSALALGRHDFEVRAVDTSNNRDGTPALYTWSVDSPPDTTITSVVDRNGNRIPNGGTIRSNAITFSFTATDNLGVRAFECRLDAAMFTACESPATYTGGGGGSHTFRVRAVDTNGFQDATPASFVWTR